MLGAAGKENFKIRRRLSHYTFFYHVAGSFEQLNMNTQAQSVCLGVDAQLLLVLTTSDVQRCFEVVVGSFSIVCYNNFLDVAGRAGISDVINFGLEIVIMTTSGCLFCCGVSCPYSACAFHADHACAFWCLRCALFHV